MRVLNLLAVICLLAACSASNDYKKHFSGNKFKVQLVVDTTKPENAFVAGLLGSMDINMDFKDDGKMIYKASMGEMTGEEQTYEWKVTGDSLITTHPSGDKEAYKISKIEGEQIFLNANDSIGLVLNKVAK